jgi:hypothetical protein
MYNVRKHEKSLCSFCDRLKTKIDFITVPSSLNDYSSFCMLLQLHKRENYMGLMQDKCRNSVYR